MLDSPFAQFYADFRTDVVIASDAGAVFGEQYPTGVGFDATRAIDVIYGRVVIQQPAFPRGKSYNRPAPTIISISPQNLLPYPARLDSDTNKNILEIVLSAITHLDEQGFQSILSEFPSEVERLAQQRRAERRPNDAVVTDSCTVSIPPTTNGDRAAASLIQNNLSEDLHTFLLTETLNDHISPKDGTNLYNLGRYLLLLRFAKIHEEAVYRARLKDGIDCRNVNHHSRTTQSPGR